MFYKKSNHLFAKLKFCTFTSDVKPFDAIPGPKSLPFIGTLWMYLPIIGKYRFNKLHRNGFLKLEQFGPLVKEEIIPGVPVVWVFKPDDIEIVYHCEGRHPQRRSHLILEKYRIDRPELYNSGGLLPTNGPEWDRIRKTIQKDISKIQNVRLYLSGSDKVIKKFLLHRVNQHCMDFLPELSRLFLELIGLVCFDESLNCFSESELKPNSRTSKLIEAATLMNNVILHTDNAVQLWKYFETPLYKKFSIAHSFIESVALEFLVKKFKTPTNTYGAKVSLLSQFIQYENLDKKDILGIIVDFLLAGIDTMAYTSSFALYHLATNQEKQEMMYVELDKLMASNDSISEEMLQKAVYTKAVIKEIHRLNPISIGIGRILAQNAILSNYHVPAGTVVVTQNQVSCRLPENFDDPNKFIPERWLRGLGSSQIHPYLVLPFGHGPRSCIARRLAEQNLQLLLMNVIFKFKLRWLGDELDCTSVQINKPDKPIQIHFDPRL